MNETITAFLLQYGLPGLAILGLWLLLHEEKKERQDRETLFHAREKLWAEENKADRATLLAALDRNTTALAHLQILERFHNEKSP